MKIVKIILAFFFIIILLSQNIFAIDTIFNKGTGWLNLGRNETDQTMDTTILRDASDRLYNIFFVAAVGVALIVGAFLGISYMMAGVSKKVEVKESLFPYFISCIVVFGSFGIWKLVVTILGSI